ncbi:MAG: bifunctional DNA-formamidopyrimidine glycosylase/DNA-(apurinic or apyrimidinic site) lyase [Elusimicrobia bacterium]|nr:bifunctional DNA-formamidopyrimidine glycosylase/DNA-(apurinic or apyrimidinic site) lyase [Elusimicrobiota bacterium]
MPELPEVETVRRVLEERLRGLRITAYKLGQPTFYRRPPDLKHLIGSTVEFVRRRGKYLVVGVSGRRELVLHLGMSGRLAFGAAGPHLRFQLMLQGEILGFHDARRFGRVGCPLPELGPEPLDSCFDPAYLHKALHDRKAPIKALLMDQRIVAGIGNIYATESLFQAGIKPRRPAGRLSKPEMARLVKAIKTVLRRAVKLGGSTLEDAAYLDPLGRPGRFQKRVSVYGRSVGACGHALKATRKPISGRTSLFCPICQK